MVLSGISKNSICPIHPEIQRDIAGRTQSFNQWKFIVRYIGIGGNK